MTAAFTLVRMISEIRAGVTAGLIGVVLTTAVAAQVHADPIVATVVAAFASVVALCCGLPPGAVNGPSAALASVGANRHAAALASVMVGLVGSSRLARVLDRVPQAVTSGLLAGSGIAVLNGALHQLGLGQAHAIARASLVGSTFAFLVICLAEATATIGPNQLKPKRDFTAIAAGSVLTAVAVGLPSTAAAARSQAVASSGHPAMWIQAGTALAVAPALPYLLTVVPGAVLALALVPIALRLIGRLPVGDSVAWFTWGLTAAVTALFSFVPGLVAGLAVHFLSQVRFSVERLGRAVT